MCSLQKPNMAVVGESEGMTWDKRNELVITRVYEDDSLRYGPFRYVPEPSIMTCE